MPECQWTPCYKQARNLFNWLQLDSWFINLVSTQPFSSWRNTQPFSQIGQMIKLCCEYLSVRCVWLYVLVVSRTRFRQNSHSRVAWMSRNSLLEAGAKSVECGFTLKRVGDMTRTFSQMHRTDKYSQHSKLIWLVWLNGWVFVYELSGWRFVSSCCPKMLILKRYHTFRLSMATSEFLLK